MAQAGNQNLISFNDQLKQTNDLANQIKDSSINSFGGVGAGGNLLGAPTGTYGVSGGYIGPAEDDSGDGGLGGAFGAARGIRAGAGLARVAGLGGAGTNALTGVADIIYLQQGFQKITDILPNLNNALQKSGEELPLVGGLFERAGGGMASLIAVGTPVIAALAGVAIALAAFEAEIKKDEQTLKDVVSAQEKYFDLVQSGTTASVQAEIDKQTATQAGLTQTRDQLQTQYNEAAQAQANAGLHGDLIQVGAQGSAMKLLGDQIQASNKQIEAGNATLSVYQQALGDSTVKANDAAAALREHLTIQDQLSKTFIADDAMTTAEITKHANETASQINTIQDNIKALQDQNATLSTTSEGYQKNQQAIQTYQNQLALLEPEYEHLTSMSLSLAQARDQEKLTTEDLKKAVDEYVKDIKDANTTQQKINDDQAKWAADAQALDVQRQQQKLDQQTAFDQQEADAEVQYQEQRLEKVNTFQASIEQIQDNAATQQAKDIQDAQIQQIQAAQSYNAKIAEINASAKLSELDAAQNLDARKLAQDLEKQQDQVNKATAQYNLEKERRQEAEDRKLADLAANENREIAQRTEAFQRQLALDDQKDSERQERDKQHFDAQELRQQEQWKRQDAARDLQHKQELDALNQHLDNIRRDQQQAWDRIKQDTTVSTSELTTIIGQAMFNLDTAASQMLTNLQQYIVQAQGMTTNPYGPVTTNNAPIINSSSAGNSSGAGGFLSGLGDLFGGWFAEGGTVPGLSSEERYIVAGESGRELLKVPGGTQVLNNTQTNQTLGGNSVQMTNHFHLNDVGKRSDEEIVALAERGVVSALDKALASLGGKQA